MGLYVRYLLRPLTHARRAPQESTPDAFSLLHHLFAHAQQQHSQLHQQHPHSLPFSQTRTTQPRPSPPSIAGHIAWNCRSHSHFWLREAGKDTLTTSIPTLTIPPTPHQPKTQPHTTPRTSVFNFAAQARPFRAGSVQLLQFPTKRQPRQRPLRQPRAPTLPAARSIEHCPASRRIETPHQEVKLATHLG